jgi:hypothetical protein
VGDPHAAQHSTAQRIELRHSTVTAAMRCPRPTGQNRFNAGMHTMRCRVHSVQCKVAGRYHATLAVLVHRMPCKQARLPSGQASLLTIHLQENSSCDPCRRATTSPLNPPPTTRPSLHPAHRRQVRVRGGHAHSCQHSKPEPDVRTEQASRRCGSLDRDCNRPHLSTLHQALPFTQPLLFLNPCPSAAMLRVQQHSLCAQRAELYLAQPGRHPSSRPSRHIYDFRQPLRYAVPQLHLVFTDVVHVMRCSTRKGREGGRKTRRTPHAAHAIGLEKQAGHLIV